MDLKERTQAVVEAIRNTKTAWVATEPENPDVAIYLNFFRGDELVCMVRCAYDPEPALAAAQIGAPGFAASTMTISFESYSSSHEVSPITGQPWKIREKQYIFETIPNASQKGWVDSCITVSAHERGGDYLTYLLPYRMDGAEVEWLEPLTRDKDERDSASGTVIEIMQKAMALPTLAEQLDQAIKDTPFEKLSLSITGSEERQFSTDMATAKALKDQGLCLDVVFAADKGSEREAQLKQHLGEPDTEGHPPYLPGTPGE